MVNSKDAAPRVLCTIAVVVMVAALITSTMLGSAVEPLGTSTGEIVRVVDQLEQSSSVRTIVYSFARQCNLTEEGLRLALSVSQGFLTLATLLVLVLALAFLRQQRRVLALRAKLHELQQRRR